MQYKLAIFRKYCVFKVKLCAAINIFKLRITVKKHVATEQIQYGTVAFLVCFAMPALFIAYTKSRRQTGRNMSFRFRDNPSKKDKKVMKSQENDEKLSNMLQERRVSVVFHLGKELKKVDFNQIRDDYIMASKEKICAVPDSTPTACNCLLKKY